MARSKPKTNEDLVLHLMQHNAAGPLVQAFVLHAIETYARQAIQAGPQAFDSALMSGEAWVRCAQDVVARIERFYEVPVQEEV